MAANPQISFKEKNKIKQNKQQQQNPHKLKKTNKPKKIPTKIPNKPTKNPKKQIHQLIFKSSRLQGLGFLNQ